MQNNYQPTNPEQAEKWSAHQFKMAEQHQAKVAAKELHRHTHGKVRKYYGHFY